MAHLCIYPGCIQNATMDMYAQTSEKSDQRILWCEKHYGLYPHQCETYGCERTVIYVDEPYCFTHSPDIGSSDPSYFAYRDPSPFKKKDT